MMLTTGIISRLRDYGAGACHIDCMAKNNKKRDIFFYAGFAGFERTE